MASYPNQLSIPPNAESDPKARELVRVWAAHGSQHVTLATNVWEDPAAWDIMLVDLARHIARAQAQQGPATADGILARLRQGFDAEWEAPTDLGSGSMTD